MKNLFFVLAILCLSLTANAQSYGVPSGGNFVTSSTGNQLGHLQAGSFGDTNTSNNARWIALGQQPTNVISPFPLPQTYGMRIQEANHSATFSLNDNASNTKDLGILWTGPSSVLRFNYGTSNNGPAPIPAMSMYSTGRVAIGDLSAIGRTTPNAELYIVEKTGGSGNGIVIDANTGRNPNLAFNINGDAKANIRMFEAANNRFEISTENSSGNLQNRFNIIQNGNVGIGTGAPSEKLTVAGNALINNVFYSSDRRYKKDIEVVQEPMDLLKSINGVTYEYDTERFPEKNFDEGTTYGFIAQDMEKELPELLRTNEEGYYSVNYDGVLPILVEAVKDLNEENETLNETNQNLAAELSELKLLVAELIKSQDKVNDESANKQGNIGFFNQVDKVNSAILYQNVPNPSEGRTEIAYQVNDKTAEVAIVVYDLNGASIQEFNNLPTGNNSVTLNQDLETGIYLYTLYTNGQEVGTKRLVVSK